MGKSEPRLSGIWMVFVRSSRDSVFVRSSWDPIKNSVSSEETFDFWSILFLLYKNFSRRTIKARNVEIDEGNEESVFHCQWMITYLILKSNRSQWLVTGLTAGLTEAEACSPAALTRRTRRTLSRRRGGRRRGGELPRCGGLPARPARRPGGLARARASDRHGDAALAGPGPGRGGPVIISGLPRPPQQAPTQESACSSSPAGRGV
jgi:hypothetical protein